ncbi:MAG: rhomboid family intramembrane serine protease, partial [Actinobacteria bacterium]
MIPLRDEDRPPIVPWATLGLLAACAAVFAYQLTLRGDAAQAFVDAWVLDPHRLGVTRLYTLLTSAFIHATWGHIVSNLLFLWVFGPGVEERSGGVRFLALYLACALAGALAYLWWPGGPDTPLVGASGAISGVLGAALVLRPRAHLRVAVLAVVVPVGVTRLQT